LRNLHAWHGPDVVLFAAASTSGATTYHTSV
jgi:hypothetical protein